MKQRFVFSFYVLLCMSGSVFSQENTAAGFSLQQAIDYAMKNHTSVLNAQYDEQIAKQKVNEVTAMGLPQVNGSFDVKDFVELPTSLIPAEFFGGPPGTFMGVKFGTQYNATAGIEASQLLFDGSYLVGLQAAKVVKDLSRVSTQRTKIEVSTQVAKAYYNVLVNEERIQLLNKNVERLQKLADDTKVLQQNGFVEAIDLDRVSVALNNLKVEQEKVSKLLELGYALLKFQMGMNQKEKLSLTDKLAAISFQPQITEFNANYTNRVEYKLMQYQLRASELFLKRDRMGFAPNLVLYGAVSANAMRNEFDIFDTQKGWYPTALIGARLGIPIFTSGMRHYRIQQSKLSVYKSQNDVKMLEQVIDLEVMSSKTMLENASRSMDIQKKNMELAENIYKVAKMKYEQGVGSNLEVLNAETSLKEAQTNYFGALFDALIAKIDYDKATGTLTK